MAYVDMYILSGIVARECYVSVYLHIFCVRLLRCYPKKNVTPLIIREYK